MVKNNANKVKRFVVRLRGLPFSANKSDVLSFLKDVEPVAVNFEFNYEGRPSGEAYVVLKNEADMKAAMAHDREMVGGRYIELFESSMEAMKWSLSRTSTHDGTLRVRGLPYEVTKKDVADFFKGFDIVPNGIGLLVDHNGRPTGEAFVQFRSNQVAEQAMSRNKEKMGHRYIELYQSTLTEANLAIERQMCINMSQQNERPRDAQPYWSGSWQHSGPYNRRSAAACPYARPSVDGQAMIGRNSKPEPPTDVHANNAWADSAPYNSGSMNPYAPEYDRGFLPPAPAPQCDSWNGQSFDPVGSYDYVQPNEPVYEKFEIRMRGLPFSATASDVLEFFHPVPPAGVMIRHNRHGRPTGEADVLFRSAWDMEQAMQRHRTMMGPRYIELFDKRKRI